MAEKKITTVVPVYVDGMVFPVVFTIPAYTARANQVARSYAIESNTQPVPVDVLMWLLADSRYRRHFAAAQTGLAELESNEPEPTPPAEPAAPESTEQNEPEDITRVNGIGPARAAQLAEAGYDTIDKIAAMDADILQQTTGLRSVDQALEIIEKAKEAAGSDAK